MLMRKLLHSGILKALDAANVHSFWSLNQLKITSFSNCSEQQNLTLSHFWFEFWIRYGIEYVRYRQKTNQTRIVAKRCVIRGQSAMAPLNGRAMTSSCRLSIE